MPNVNGLAMAGYFMMSCPEPQPNKITKDEIKNKKLSKEKSAGTTDDRSTKAEEMQVSPAIAKPAVGGECSYCQYVSNYLPFLCLLLSSL